ncbi:MAG: hypothetical protein ABWY19_15815 [Marmoricola sp.]
MSERYAVRWATAWFALACPVVLAGLLVWSAPGVGVLLVVGLGVTTALLVGVATAPGYAAALTGPLLRRTLAASGRWAVVEVAVAVCAIQAPLVALLVIAALVGSSPWARRRIGRRRVSPPTALRAAPVWRSPQELDGLTPERIRSLVRRLDVAGLCRAWRSSHALLGEVHDVETRTKVVLLRQEYLDEMERRDAAGFQRWLEADAQASGDPEAFLRSGSGGDEEAAA